MRLKTASYKKRFKLYSEIYKPYAEEKLSLSADDQKSLYQKMIVDAENRVRDTECEPSFWIGYIPPSKYYQIEAMKQENQLFKKEGEQIKRVLSFEKFFSNQLEINRLIFKYGLRGFDGFQGDDNVNNIECIKEKIIIDNFECEIITDEMVSLLLNQSFVVYLPEFVLMFQSLSDEEKKS